MLRDGPVAQGQTILVRRAFAEGDDRADELVPGYDRSLAVAFTVGIAPEHRRSGVAFDVRGADARRVYADDDLARPGLGRGLFL